jgi:hypothetical protein
LGSSRSYLKICYSCYLCCFFAYFGCIMLTCQISANAVTSAASLSRMPFVATSAALFACCYCCSIACILILLSLMLLAIMPLTLPAATCYRLHVATTYVALALCCYYCCYSDFNFGLVLLYTLTDFWFCCRTCFMMLVLQCWQMLPLLVL